MQGLPPLRWSQERAGAAGELRAGPLPGPEAAPGAGLRGRKPGCGAGRPGAGGGAGEPAGWERGAHLYVTLEFAATSEREAVRAGAEGLRGRRRCAPRGGRRSEPRAETAARERRAGAPSRSRSSPVEAPGPARRAPAGPSM